MVAVNKTLTFQVVQFLGHITPYTEPTDIEHLDHYDVSGPLLPGIPLKLVPNTLRLSPKMYGSVSSIFCSKDRYTHPIFGIYKS